MNDLFYSYPRKRRRRLLKTFDTIVGEKILELSNLAIAGLVFDQLISERPFDLFIFIAAFSLAVSLYFGIWYIGNSFS